MMALLLGEGANPVGEDQRSGGAPGRRGAQMLLRGKKPRKNLISGRSLTHCVIETPGIKELNRR
jgi:hypothetical protein